VRDFEGLGSFYLGRRYDSALGRATDEPILYDARDLTTHAICVGMTGSGKTGLCIGLLEEAALDGIPAIAIDPKGDLGNLLLTFPELRAGDFLPWIDPAEAARAGRTPEAHAEATAAAWRAGLAAGGQTPDRIARLRAAADLRLFTPGSRAGAPLNVLRSLGAPPAALAADPDAWQERMLGAVSGLLVLLGIAADPLRDREPILLATILDRAWKSGGALDLAALIQAIQSPPFDRVGVLDLESFYPARDRFALAMRINNLLASPGFTAWMEGQPLEIGQLLSTPEGRPRLAVVSIAHLSDSERMFFVTLLLNEIVGWMRLQPGTGSLRAILYMDEIYGFFPPTAAPPSKAPMLTLLKQARAFGLGVVLATQNPVDLDYKGLANAGTWFLGRLQTERDKERVLDGLSGASAAASRVFDRQRIDATLSSLGKRVFLLHNVHEEEPVLFETRWTMSYLRGPLTREQIRALAAAPAEPDAAVPAAAPGPPPGGSFAISRAGAPPPDAATTPASVQASPPLLPPGIAVTFVAGAPARPYRPLLLAVARLHFVSAASQLDWWEDLRLLVPIPIGAEGIAWEAATPFEGAEATAASPQALFDPLPPAAARADSYVAWRTSLVDHLYRNRTLMVWRAPALNEVSRPGETEGTFRARLALTLRERRDAERARLERKYSPKLRALQERRRRAAERVERERDQVSEAGRDVVISVGATVLGALFGRRVVSAGTVGRATTAARRASRAAEERQDVGRAEDALAAVDSELAALNAAVEGELSPLRGDAAGVEIEALAVRPRKADVGVSRMALAWVAEPVVG
jgi:hypothetical protein